MRVVLGFNDNYVSVSFEDKLNNPWDMLALVGRDIPEILERQVVFTKKIPQAKKYILWENFYDKAEWSQTDNLRKAIRFIRRKDQYPVLRDLLKKYAVNES